MPTSDSPSYSDHLLTGGSALTRFPTARVSTCSRPHSSRRLFPRPTDAVTAFSFTKRSEKASGIGVDISAEMLQSATARFSGSARLPIPQARRNIESGSCDLIFCTEALEQVGDAAAVLRHSLARIVARRQPADFRPNWSRAIAASQTGPAVL